MTGLDQTRQQMAQDLNHKPLNRGFAKFEILLGLLAASCGQVLILIAVRDVTNWAFVIGGVVLFTLGGYLAMAGHRSHLYQSANDQTAYLLIQLKSELFSGENGEDQA